jgi:hypothetical protein
MQRLLATGFICVSVSVSACASPRAEQPVQSTGRSSSARPDAAAPSGLLDPDKFMAAMDAIEKRAPLKLHVALKGESTAANLFAYALREKIRASKGYTLVELGTESDVGIMMTAMDMPCGPGGSSSAAAIAIDWVAREHHEYIRGALIVVGQQAAEEMAQRQMAQTDTFISEWRAGR